MADENQARLQELMQEAKRAARRGDKETASQRLAQLLREDSANEEAWLWLARVVDDPSQKAESLKRALELNPDNRWAAEQLAELEMDAATAVPPRDLPTEEGTAVRPAPEPAAKGYELKLLTCPNCGGQVELRGGEQSLSAVCEHCQTVLDLTSEADLQVGTARPRIRPRVPIHPGMEMTWEGERYQVLGWLQYEGWDDEDRWRWDEWLLVSGSGAFLWLSYDDEAGFTLQRKVPLPAEQMQGYDPRRAFHIPTSHGNVRVKERAPAKVVQMAGEFTWRVKVGDRMNYLDASSRGKRYSLEYTKEEIELFEGTPLKAEQVWRAFGREDLAEREVKRARRQAAFRTVAALCGLFALIGLLGAGVALVSGQAVLRKEVTLNQGSTAVNIGSFVVSKPNRPHQVRLRTSGMPVNNWAVVDVTAYGPAEGEFYLFSAEFWDEEGRDSEGYWHEKDYREENVFVPDEAGPYRLELSMEEATVPQIPVQVIVREGVILSRYFFLYSCAAIAAAFMLLVFSAGGRVTFSSGD